MTSTAPLSVKLFARHLTISIGIDTLAFAFERSPIAQPYDDEICAFRQLYRVSDKRAFARAVCRALETEKEDGTTPVHELLDSAMEKATEDGEGVKELEECTPADEDSP